MGKILQVLFICLQQADMQINFLDSCVSTKWEEATRRLAELSIPHPAPFPRGPRYSRQLCRARKKGATRETKVRKSKSAQGN